MTSVNNRRPQLWTRRFSALTNNTIGIENVAEGVGALQNNTTDGRNTAIGAFTLVANVSGKNKSPWVTRPGYASPLATTISISAMPVIGDSNTIRIGTREVQQNCFIAGISGVTVADGVSVVIDTNGHLGTVVSSVRFKEDVTPMDRASESILSLQPVTFHYKHELDPEGIPQFGLVAEQVEEVAPALVAHDLEGKPYSVRYEAVNAMLLNEFLKEHRKVEAQATKSQEQDATIAQLKSAIAQQQKEIQVLTASLKEQAAQIQTVSERLEKSRPAPRLVANDQ